MTNDSSINEVICWNCYKKTPPPICIHCGAKLKLIAEEPFKEKTSETISAKKIFYEIPGSNIRINLQALLEIVSQHFQILSMPSPSKLTLRVNTLENDNETIEEKLENIRKKVSKIAPELYPFLSKEPISSGFILTFHYIPSFPNIKWLKIFYYGFLIISAFIPAYGWLMLQGNPSIINMINIKSPQVWSVLIIGIIFIMGFSNHIFLSNYFKHKKLQEKQSNIIIPSIPSIPVGAIAWLNESIEPPYSKQKQIIVEFSKWLAHLIYSLVIISLGLLIPWKSNVVLTQKTGLNEFIILFLRLLKFNDMPSPIYFAGIMYLTFTLLQGLPLGNLIGGKLFSALFPKNIQNIVLAVVIFLLLNVDLTVGIFGLFLFFFSRKIPPMDSATPIKQNEKIIALIPVIISLLFISLGILYQILS